MKGDVDAATAAARRDLAALETALRADLATAKTDMRTENLSLHDSVAALEARITAHRA